MNKQAKQTKIKLERGVVQAEQNTIHDNSLLPTADELERLVAIDKNLLQWVLSRSEIEQDARIDFNKNSMQEYRSHGKRTFWVAIISIILAFIIIAGGGIASVYLALKGFSIEGSILGGVTLVAAAGVFLKRSKQNNSEMSY